MSRRDKYVPFVKNALCRRPSRSEVLVFRGINLIGVPPVLHRNNARKQITHTSLVNLVFLISYELGSPTGSNSEVSPETEGIFRLLLWPVERKGRNTWGKIALINGGNIF